MTNVALLAYVPDPFAVQTSSYVVREQNGIIRALTAAELSDYPSQIMTYELPSLVDDLRRQGRAPPRKVVDIGDAIRLAVGQSKDDGGEKLWNVWSALKSRFDTREDAVAFELVAVARIDRPAADELSRLLHAAVNALERLWTDQIEYLGRVGELRRLIEVEWPLQSLFAYRQFRGLRVDLSGAAELLARISAEKYGAYREVAEILNKSPTGLTFWNIHPYLELTDVAFLGDLDAGGRLQDAFEIAAARSKFAAAFLTLSKAGRDESVVRRALGGDERLYPIFNVLGTVSGRILVSDPHLQQLRRAYRSLIVADPNSKLIYLDYSQFEPGILAGLSGDEGLIAAYNAGDLYTSLALLLFGNEASRPAAKRVFLAFLYGMSPERVSSLLCGPTISQTDRKTYEDKINSFFKAYPRLASYRAEQESKLLNCGFVSSLFGNRRVRCRDGGLTPKERRWALNQPVQATASLIFKEALLQIASEFGADRIILPVHDALLMQFTDDETFDSQVARAQELMAQAFSNRIPAVLARVTAGTFGE